MEKLNITTGKIVTRTVESEKGKYVKVLSIDGGAHNIGESVCNITTRDEDRAYGNADLICDALTTYLDCGIMPSELLRQRTELLQALKESTKVINSLKLSMMAHPDHEEGIEFWDFTDSAETRQDANLDLIRQIENE